MTSRIRNLIRVPAFARNALGVFLAIPVSLQAQLVVDVNQPLYQSMPYIDSQASGMNILPGPLAQQTFIAQAPIIAGGGFLWHAGSFPLFTCDPTCHALEPRPHEVEITLSTGFSTVNPLAQTRVLFDPTGTAGTWAQGVNDWVDAFWNPISVTSGATYVLSIQAIVVSANSGPGFRGNVYTGGSAFIYGGIMDPFNAPPEGYYDFAFRTWSVVPEPSTYALVAAGLLAIGVAARRRRRGVMLST